jgi:putative transposase
VIVEFIGEHAHRRQSEADGGLRWGVEPICTVLSEHGRGIAPSTYDEHLARTATARARRDVYLLEQTRRVHREDFAVCGARKIWLARNREGIAVARCTVERLMRGAGLAGARRGKVKKTTIADPDGPRPSAPDGSVLAGRPPAVRVRSWSGPGARNT